MPRDAQYFEFTRFAHVLADAASQATLGGFRQPLPVDNKWRKGFDPVTAADRVEVNDSEQGCDCCGRKLHANAEPHRGFYLCAACQADDVELALLVAKARHRRRLMKLKERLEEGADGDR